MPRNYRQAAIPSAGPLRSIRALLWLLGLLALGTVLLAPSWAADQRSVRFSLGGLPEKESWAGLWFEGAKVGYSHVRIEPVAGTRHFVIESETRMRLRLLGFDKTLGFRSRDVVDEDLALLRFEADYRMDGNSLALKGSAVPGGLLLEVSNAGVASRQELKHSGILHPASAIPYFAFVHGLEPGLQYRYSAFIGETLQIGEIVQKVGALESGPDFSGQAYRVLTQIDGQDSSAWLSPDGRVLLEIALNGKLKAVAETEQGARLYLEEAGLQHRDLVLEASLVRADRVVALPRRIARMALQLDGVALEVPSGVGQQCDLRGATWHCQLDSGFGEKASGDPAAYLEPSLTVPSTHPDIVSLARKLAPEGGADEKKVRAILDWLDANIRKEGADSFSALDVLNSRRAECQGHTYLYAALARASGIPTRVANGLVYSEGAAGFLYHTWAESLLGGEWRSVDPTFGQARADATHVKLLEGESYADMAPITGLIGGVTARIAALEYLR